MDKLPVLVVLTALVVISGCADSLPGNENSETKPIHSSITGGINFEHVLVESNISRDDYSSGSHVEAEGYFNESLITDIHAQRFNSVSGSKSITFRVMEFENESVAEDQVEKVLDQRLKPDSTLRKSLKSTKVVFDVNGTEYTDSISRESNIVYSVKLSGFDNPYFHVEKLRRELGNEVRGVEEARDLNQSFEANVEMLTLSINDFSRLEEFNASNYTILSVSNQGIYKESNLENVSQRQETMFLAKSGVEGPTTFISTVTRYDTVAQAHNSVEEFTQSISESENGTVEKHKLFSGYNSTYKVTFRPSPGSEIRNVGFVERKQNVVVRLIVSGDQYYEEEAEDIYIQSALPLLSYRSS
jgi:hypothetical protein